MKSISCINNDELRRIGPPVAEIAVGRGLAAWLSDSYHFFSPEQWSAEIIEGRITVNQQIVTNPHRELALHDRIARIHPLSEEPEVDTALTLLYRDEDVAVIAKPAGLPMHEAGFFRRKTVRWLLPQFLGDDWHAVHRLDRETSGILVCARGRERREALAKLLQHGGVTKTYLAVCAGMPPADSWIDHTAILPARSPLEPNTCTTGDNPRGQVAETHFRLLKLCGPHALIEAQPRTGRTHQIRVHLARVGLPIVGDKIYGPNKQVFASYIQYGNTDEVKQMAGHPRHLLHAHRIEFTDPVTAKLISVVCDMPEEMRSLLV